MKARVNFSFTRNVFDPDSTVSKTGLTPALFGEDRRVTQKDARPGRATECDRRSRNKSPPTSRRVACSTQAQKRQRWRWQDHRDGLAGGQCCRARRVLCAAEDEAPVLSLYVNVSFIAPECGAVVTHDFDEPFRIANLPLD